MTAPSNVGAVIFAVCKDVLLIKFCECKKMITYVLRCFFQK